MDKDQVKRLQNELWMSTSKPGKAPPKPVLEAIRVISKLQTECDRLSKRAPRRRERRPRREEGCRREEDDEREEARSREEDDEEDQSRKNTVKYFLPTM